MKKGEIWIAELPEGKGHEQKGERPAIIMGKANGLAIAIPLTSNLDRAKFPFTELVEQSPESGLSSDSIALVFQLSSQDECRFKRKIGELDSEKQASIDMLVANLLKIKA